MSQMLKSSGGLAVATMASRILGMVREICYGWLLGTTPVAGAFIFAFMVPNLFRRLLGEGALTAAFIPLFKQKEKSEGEAAMWETANGVISALIAVTGLIVVVGIAGIWVALRFEMPVHTRLVLSLLQVMLPYVLLVCLAATLMSMLNARGHFFVPALGATLLNVVMIGSVFLLAPLMGPHDYQQVFGLAIGVLIAGFLQAAFQYPQLHREGFRFRWITPWKSESVRHVARLMIPGTIGVAAFQINIFTTQGLAYLNDPSIVASFNYAVRLMELPQGVFGLSLATYLLPTLTGLAVEKRFPDYRSTLREGLSHLLFLNMLAGAMLFVLPAPMLRLLFEHGGKFDAQSTASAAPALMWLAPGLVAYSLVNILARAFYSLNDIHTPMRISVFSLALNLVLTAGLVWRYKQSGLALANTVSAIANAALLFYALRRKLNSAEFIPQKSHLLSLGGAAVLAGMIAWGVHGFWDARLGHHSLLLRLGEVFVPMSLATAVYFVVAHLLGVESTQQLRAFFRRRSKQV